MIKASNNGVKGGDDPNIAVQIHGLLKTYPGSKNVGCYKCKKNSPYHSLKVGLTIFPAGLGAYEDLPLVVRGWVVNFRGW